MFERLNRQGRALLQSLRPSRHAETKQPAAPTVTAPSTGWSPRANAAGPVNATRSAVPPPPSPATFSEVLQSFQAIARDGSLTPAAREAAVERLIDTASAMGIGGANPFVPLVNEAAADALQLSGAQRLAYVAGKNARMKMDLLSGALGPPFPAVPSRIPSDPEKARVLGSSNALLAAQVVTGAYGKSKERIVSMMKGQFDSAKVVDGQPQPLGGRALVGTRNGPHPMTMIGFRGTDNLPDAVRDATMGCLTIDKKGKPCFKLESGAKAGYGAGAVHAGFAQHLDTVWPSLREEILDAARHHRTVEITGHSLGAATAELAMARALNDPDIAAALRASTAEPKATLVTFAQPAVGDAAFEKDFKGKLDALGIPFHTYGYRNDPVMQVPPTGLPDAQGRTFALPSAEFAQLDSGPDGARLTPGRPPADVRQNIRTGDLTSFFTDATDFALSAAGKGANGYPKLADHAPQNYWGALLELNQDKNERNSTSVIATVGR